eukprot:TRINITY_DN19858_c0_g1_i1.p1 TRINITY_DN19858_c0_g1~~TRINITY_DN19858_c0_g1_i1.p1  ORF type:complete len:1144 (-),score=190.83 TRINITY_DN19858_c0_g1_i1:157-3198(-)
MSSLIIEGELAQMPVLKECSSDFVSHLAGEAAGKVYGEGQVICSKGQHGNAMYVVIRGKAVASVGGVRVMELHKGDYIGESLMLGIGNTWTTTLMSESASCMICEISQSVFHEALSKFPNEKEHFVSLMGVSVMRDPVGTTQDTCPIFGGMPEALLMEIEQNMVSRSLFPGQTILGQGIGSGTHDLVLLIKGTVSVELAGRGVRTEQQGELADDLELEVEVVDSGDTSPPCFGELEVLGLNDVRKAEVKAVTACHVRILHKPVLEEILASNADLTRGAVMKKVPLAKPQQVEECIRQLLQIFTDAGCSADFLKFLGDNLEERLYVQNKTMVDFKAGSRSLHVLVTGTASVHETNDKTRELCVGEVFGGMKVLGVAARPEEAKSIIASDQCRCQVLHQSVVVRALELFPDQRMKVLNIASRGRQELSDRANSKADFIEILQKSPFFCNTHPDFIEELGKAAIDRIFMPGDFIVFEGDVGYSMFILVNGSADVFMQDPEKKSQEAAKRERQKTIKSMPRVGHLAPGAIAGELAMLGITQTRSATIQAASLCVLWEVNQERAMAILDRFPEEQSLFSKVIVQNLDLTVPARLLALPLFKNFDRKFRMLLTLYCERHAFFPDHKVLREGENGDKLWILNTGPAMLQKKGHTVKIFSPGSHFGCDHMLGINRSYCGTLVAMTVSHMLAVSRSSYLLALEQYPAKQASQELLRAQRVECQAIRENVERTAIRKGIWTRYQGDVNQNSPGIRELSNDDLLKRLVKCWHECVKVLRERRIQKEQGEADRQFMLENWRLKQEETRKKLEPKRRLQALLASNIGERGPLKVFDPSDTSKNDSNTAVPSRLPAAKTTHPSAGLGPDTEHLVTYLQSWPQPRPSPHYNLKVWGVVRDELLAQHQGQRKMKLLPLLSSGQKTVEKARTISVERQESVDDENSDDEYWSTGRDKEDEETSTPLPDLPPLKGRISSMRKTVEGRRSIFQSQAAMLKAMQQLQATDISETDAAHIRPATPDDFYGPPPH